MPFPTLQAVKADAGVEFGPGFLLEKSPQAAQRLGACIALWSDVELQIARIFANVLGTTAELAFEIYAALRGRQFQERMTHLAVRANLGQGYLDLLKLLLKHVASAANSEISLHTG